MDTIDTVRRDQAAIYSLHPAAKKVPATLNRERDGLARHRDFPDIALAKTIQPDTGTPPGSSP
jgi:hypothetical protein